jgi:hypothetical protein
MMRQICSPETSVRNNRYSLRNSPGERGSDLLRSGRKKLAPFPNFLTENISVFSHNLLQVKMNTPLFLNRKAKYKIRGFATLLLCINLCIIYWQQYHILVRKPKEMNLYIIIQLSSFFFAIPNFVE